jgi:hypothetical protein
MGAIILSRWDIVVALLIAISPLRDITACPCTKLYNTLMINLTLLRNKHIKNSHRKVQKGKVILAFNYAITP